MVLGVGLRLLDQKGEQVGSLDSAYFVENGGDTRLLLMEAQALLVRRASRIRKVKLVSSSSMQILETWMEATMKAPT